jgi:APA family basic amino acid/polyamine antiporter
MANLLATKPLNLLMEEARETGEHSLKRTLGVFQLTALGVGAVIGAGIFVMVGLGAQYACSSFYPASGVPLPGSATPSSQP